MYKDYFYFEEFTENWHPWPPFEMLTRDSIFSTPFILNATKATASVASQRSKVAKDNKRDLSQCTYKLLVSLDPKLQGWQKRLVNSD